MSTILLCEHDSDVSLMIRSVLEEFGHQVEIPHSSAEALALAKSGQFNAAIINPNFKLVNAMAVAEELQRKQGGTPVILVSSSFAEGATVSARMRAAGIRTLLRKPFTLPQLQQSLETVLKKHDL